MARTSLTVFMATVLFVCQTVVADELDTSKEQAWTIRALINKLEDSHYIDQRYNDAMSSEHLSTYLDALDPSRLYFTQADIDAFDAYELTLDDRGRQGDLAPALAIYTRYQTLADERLTTVIDDMDTMIAGFDFSKEEFIVADPTTRHWALNAEALDERWRKRVKNQVLSLRIADKDPDAIVTTLRKRYENQQNRLEQYNSQDVFAVYANALAARFDPHTSYFSPRKAENFDIDMRLSLEGIGAVLQTEDEYVKVVRVVPAGPADNQTDLKAAELIIGVGQGVEGELTDVIGWRLDDVVDQIRGKKGTIVRLDVIPSPGRSDEVRRLTITREKVKLEEQAAKSKIIEINDLSGETKTIGVIDIRAFYLDFEGYRQGDPNYRSTTRDVRKLITELESSGVDGLVIDLRGNGGGSLREANELTGLFIEYGPTVQIKGAGSRVWRDGKRRRSDFYEGPLAVMIDRLSASASEIFAGALQDYGRAIIVGDRSFGKGTVQTLLDLPEGQLKITESKFYRISGDSTQHRGVIPDIRYPSVLQHDEIGESALENALDWDRIAPVRHKDYAAVDAILPTLLTQHNARVSTDPEFQYIWSRKALAKSLSAVDSLPLQEAARLEQRVSQEASYLAIENTRREAKGLAAMDSIDELLDADSDSDAADSDSGDEELDAPEASQASAEEDDDDALITETARILVDSITLTSATLRVTGT